MFTSRDNQAAQLSRPSLKRGVLYRLCSPYLYQAAQLSRPSLKLNGYRRLAAPIKIRRLS